jgi:hypothetical protein
MKTSEIIKAAWEYGYGTICEDKDEDQSLYVYCENSYSPFINLQGASKNWRSTAIESTNADEDEVDKFKVIDFVYLGDWAGDKPFENGQRVEFYSNENKAEKREGEIKSKKNEYGEWEIDVSNMFGTPFRSKAFIKPVFLLSKTVETIEIGGQKYSKEEVEARLKDLKPISS